MGESLMGARGRCVLAAVTVFFSLVACESAVTDAAHSGDAAAGDGVNVTPPCEVAQDCASLAASGGCEVATCDLSTSTCELLAAPNGTACAASEATCGVAGTCEAGLCVSSPSAGADCDDGNPCTVDVCAPGAGCSHFSIPDGSSCDDERTCTSSDMCLAGTCEGTELEPDCAEPECGDAACDDTEDEDSCPEDCPGEVNSVCGDGDCAEDESAETCSEDCAVTDSECGDGLCEGAESFFCPQDCE